MSSLTIQIFACDHRKNVQWKLPFIRLGNFQSDAFVNIKNDNDIASFQLLLSEGAQIWYVWKHLIEFGNPEYVGFCHYRRFFGFANKPIYDMSEEYLDYSKILNPIDQLNIIVQNKLDGLIPICFNPLPKSQQIQYDNISQQTKLISDHDGLGFTTEIVDKAFQFLIESTSSLSIKDKIQKAYLDENIYVCNIFTMNTSLFNEYCKICFSAIKKLIEFTKDKDTSKFHKRWIGYIMERYTSCVIKAFQMNGAKFGVVPLLTIDGWKHEFFEKHVGI